MAVVRIEVLPKQDATIFINGENVGDVTSYDELYVNLSEGSYQIEARNKNWWQLGSVRVVLDSNAMKEIQDHTMRTGDAYTITIPAVEKSVVAAHSAGCSVPTNYAQPNEAPCSPEKSYMCAKLAGQCFGSINHETEPYLWQCTHGVWKVVQINSPYCGAPSAPCQSGVPEVCSAERNNYSDAYKIFPCKGGHYSSNFFDTEVYGANTLQCQGPGPVLQNGIQWGLWGNPKGQCVAGTKRCVVEDGAQPVDSDGAQLELQKW